MTAWLFDRPFTALLKREVVSQLRTIRAFLLLCLIMGGLIIVMSQTMRYMQGAMAAASFSRRLFDLFTQALNIAAVLFVPLFAATSVCVERQRDTLEQLLLTTLRPRQIVMGKALSAFSFYFFITVALFPLAGVMFFYVGIDWNQFLHVVAAASLLAFMSAMVGVACSARFTHTLTAVIMSLVIVWLFSGIGAAAIRAGLRFTGKQNWYWWIRFWPLVLAGLCFLTARRRIAKACRTSRFMQMLETPIGHTSPMLTESSFRRSEAAGRRRLTFSRSLLYVLSALCIFLFGFIAWHMRMWDGWRVWIAMQGILLVLLSTSAVAPQFTREHEQNTFDLLRMTLLSPFGVVAGKLASAAAAMLPFHCGILASAAILLFRANSQEIAAIISAHFIMLAYTLMNMCAVQFAALQTRRTSVALVLGYGITLAGFIATVMLLDVIQHTIMRGPQFEFPTLVIAGYGFLFLVVAAALLAASTARYSMEHSRPLSLSRLRARYLAPLLLVCLAFGCGHDPRPVVVVYTALDEMFSRPILDDFEQQTGIEVRAVYDTEAAKTTGLVTRLIAERNRPRADVFWNNETAQTIVLKTKGVLAPYRSPAAEPIPAQFKDADAYWTGFAARGRVIIYNTNLTAAPPTSIHDFVKPEWSGKLAVALPLFGTTATHTAALFAQWGDDEAKAFLQNLTANNVAVLPGNATVRDRVAQGEFVAGLTDTDDANGGIEDGYPVKWLFPDQDALGTLVIPNTVALVAASPNPEGGKKLIDYLLSAEVEARLANGRSMQIPLNPNVQAPENVPRLNDIKTMPVSFEAIAAKMEAATEAARAEFMK